MFQGLTISQLKVCYELFGKIETSFYSDKFTCSRVDSDNLTYFMINNRVNNDNRILFHPVTIYPNQEPSAQDLASCLAYYQTKISVKSPNNISRIIIPIGEITRHKYLPSFHHMVTLIIDFLPQRKLVNAQIIDSFRFSLPWYHQTESIVEIVDHFYDVVEFKREYLNHQNIFDRSSCCYFTLKIIQKALEDQVSNGYAQPFVQNIPSPNSWIITSQNWLTIEQRKEVIDNIKSYFIIQESSNEELDLTDEIIELE